MIKKYIAFTILVFNVKLAMLQDLSNIKSSKPLKISGGIGGTSNFYSIKGMEARGEPFTWQLNANLTFDMYGWTVPFSGTLTNREKSYTQPFNKYGLSPRYKWITLHAGYRSMQFSSYTLSGIAFLGGGVELAPPKIPVKFSGMYGRFNKAVEYHANTPAYELAQPAYERWGWGSKVMIGKRDHLAEVMVFRAKDDVNSVIGFPEKLNIKPAENLAFGINSKNKIGKHLNIGVEYAISAFTSDIRAPEYEYNSDFYQRTMDKVFVTRVSSEFKSAIVANINSNVKSVNIGGTFRQVDPGYRSLGTPFLNNDLREYLFNIARNFMNGKINISANTGIQHNNINKKAKKAVSRFVGAINTSVAATEKLSLNFNYSNNNSTTAPTILTIMDTIKMVQLTESQCVSLAYNFGDKDKMLQSITGTFSMNKAVENYESPAEDRRVVSRFYNQDVSYQMNLVPIKVNIAATISYSLTAMTGINSSSLGPNLSASKSFLGNKFSTNASFSNMRVYQDGKQNGSCYVLRTGGSYSVNKHHSFNISCNYLYKKAFSENEKSFNEVRGNVGYRFNF